MTNKSITPSVTVAIYIAPTIHVYLICDIALTKRTGDLPLQQQRTGKDEVMNHKRTETEKKINNCHFTTIESICRFFPIKYPYF